MTVYLLNSNHASPLVTLHHPLRARVFQAHRAGDVFALVPPVIAETWFGISLLPRAVQNRQEWMSIQGLMSVYAVDAQDGIDAAELQLTLRAKGAQLETFDALIAAIALRYDLTLLTSDGDFAAIPGLTQANWLVP